MGHSVSAGECQREQSELIKDPPYPGSQEIRRYGDADISQRETGDAVAPNAFTLTAAISAGKKGGRKTLANLKSLKTI